MGFIRHLIACSFLCFVSFALVPAAVGQGAIRDAEIESMLRDYSDPVLSAAGLQPRDVSLYIVNDRSINAFVTRGQNIFVHTGIILETEKPNELIGVIAHETGHISGGHLARQSDAMSKASRPMLLTMGLGVLAAVAGEPQAGAALISSAQQFGAMTFFSHSRVQEAAADQAGARFLEATGQSGNGLLKFYERFRFQEVMSGAKRFPYFRTHPLSSERIDSLAEQVSRSEFVDQQDNEAALLRLEMVKAKIVGFLDTPNRTFALYPETDQSLPGKYARAIAYYQAADTKIALQKIDELIVMQPENPYFNELYGQVLFESGQTEKAIQYHAKSVTMLPESPLLRLNWAQALLARAQQKDLQLARKQLDFVIAAEPDNSFGYYLLSVLHEKEGNLGLAKLATAEQAYAMGDYFRAQGFAYRAKDDLEPQTISWRRANDILQVIATDPQIQKAIQRSRRRPTRR